MGHTSQQHGRSNLYWEVWTRRGVTHCSWPWRHPILLKWRYWLPSPSSLFFVHSLSLSRSISDFLKVLSWKLNYYVIQLEQWFLFSFCSFRLVLNLWSSCDLLYKVRVNDPSVQPAHFSTGLIGRDNAIARHGIHGLYWFYSVDLAGNLFQEGSNTVYLTQSRRGNLFQGLMYDYLRLEGPPDRWSCGRFYKIVRPLQETHYSDVYKSTSSVIFVIKKIDHII